MTIPQAPPRADLAVLRDSLGVGVAVGVSGVAFGGTAVAAGLSVLQACALSLLAFTGASQYALIGTIAAGANPLVGIPGAVLLGARNSLYGLRLGRSLDLPTVRREMAGRVTSRLAGRAAVRAGAAQFVIDETTAVTLAQPDRRAARLGFAITGATLFVLWNGTTLAGAAGATALGDPTRYGLDAAGPAAFLALLLPQVRGDRSAAAVAVLAVVLALAATPLLPSGVPILLAVLAVPAVLVARRTPAGGTR